MAKKIREFITELQKTGGIKSTELETALAASALNDIELPDDFVTGFESSFMTADRAKNDPTIVEHVKKALSKSDKTVLDNFDERIKNYFQFIDKDDQEAINKEPKTFEKWDMLKAALKKQQAAGKGKVNEDANRILEEKENEIKTLKKTHAEELTRQKEEINTAIVDSSLKTKILAFRFADAFATPDWRTSIAELTLNAIRKEYTLSVENGETKLLVKSGDSLVEAFEGNEKLTVDKLLERKLDKFIAKSNGANGQNGNGAALPNGGTVKVPDLKNATLDELRKMTATY